MNDFNLKLSPDLGLVYPPTLWSNERLAIPTLTLDYWSSHIHARVWGKTERKEVRAKVRDIDLVL